MHTIAATLRRYPKEKCNEERCIVIIFNDANFLVFSVHTECSESR